MPDVGVVEHWRDLISAQLPLVSFRHTYRFPDGECVSSDSTLRFKSKEELEASLTQSGYAVVEVRQAPDRPDAEFVVFARRGR